MKITSNEILTLRDTYSKEISNCWNIIYSENKATKKYERKYDLGKILDRIHTLSELRIKVKMHSIAINLGITNFSDFPKNSCYLTIFELSEKNEEYVKLGLIETISPIERKIKKNLTEKFSFNFIKAKKDTLLKEITGLKKRLSEFNEKASLIIDTEMAIAA